jgi:hypothetical protein
MQLNAEVPLAYIVGIEIRATIAGRNAVELKCFDCNLPLPPDSQEGRSIITMTLHTTEGDVQMQAVTAPCSALQPFKPKGYIAEEMLRKALAGEREAVILEKVTTPIIPAAV